MVSHAQLVNKVVDDPRSVHRQGPAAEVTQKLQVPTVEVPKIRFIDILVYVPVFTQRQPRMMDFRTTGRVVGSVPQIVDQIVEAPRIIPHDLVLQGAAVEDIAKVSPRGESDVCSVRLLPQACSQEEEVHLRERHEGWRTIRT